ncbi:hypothetical protein N3K66_004113 [Trichothecium roseum]|uniref:Uncharacterized protein n=1 Tax=Trichothecium roseum TaxID=47278 RepID=A0ACC0V257_9HYPO|nr:hypothetical protein N3K66_004113 [Trichothecium roseum]
MADNITLVAVTEAIASLASPPESRNVDLAAGVAALDLPGDDTPEKQALAAELQKLAARIAQLESSTGLLIPDTHATSGDEGDIQANPAGFGKAMLEINAVAALIARGDFTSKVEADTAALGPGIDGLKHNVNAIVDNLGMFSAELARLTDEVGTQSLFGGQMRVDDVDGSWKEMTQNVNGMVSNLTTQVRQITHAVYHINQGNFEKRLDNDTASRGEILQLQQFIDSVAGRLGTLASTITHITREFGPSDSSLLTATTSAETPERGRNAWDDLQTSLSSTGNTLTNLIRKVTTITAAVSKGDLSHRIDTECHGEAQVLKETMNEMMVNLHSFTDEMAALLREIGIQGRLCGQVSLGDDVQGVWKDLAIDANTMSSNLGTQLRALTAVTHAVANRRAVEETVVEARGELQMLKDTINAIAISATGPKAQAVG